MITSITSSSPHVYASGGSNLPYIPSNPSNPAQGSLKLNGSTLEVFDGMSWRAISISTANVGLYEDANNAISWAIKKMKEEQEWYKLATTNEAVRIALDQLEQAQTRLELTAHLARDYDKETTS